MRRNREAMFSKFRGRCLSTRALVPEAGRSSTVTASEQCSLYWATESNVTGSGCAEQWAGMEVVRLQTIVLTERSLPYWLNTAYRTERTQTLVLTECSLRYRQNTDYRNERTQTTALTEHRLSYWENPDHCIDRTQTNILTEHSLSYWQNAAYGIDRTQTNILREHSLSYW
jgi:uncharacterized protein YccT (UPF0319 family)